jgi:epimerase transport system membrane fusion protein
LRSQLIATRALEARLLAERDGLADVNFGSNSAEAREQEARSNEARIFSARRTARLGEEEVLNKRIVQLEEQARGIRAVIAGKQALAASYREEITDLRALLQDGYVDKLRLREQERNLAQLDSDVAELRSAVARIELQAGETRLQIIQLQKDFAREVADKLAEAQTLLFELRERLATAEDRLRRTRILAPEAGMVMGLSVHTVGGVIGPGTPLLDIVPADQPLVVDVQISPLDIDRVQVGKRAEVRFSAFSSSITPVIEGTLTRVSADRLINEQSGAPYYLGRVELTEKGRRDLGELLLVPGMPAEVLLNTGERTLLNYLVQPATNALARSMIED